MGSAISSPSTVRPESKKLLQEFKSERENMDRRMQSFSGQNSCSASIDVGLRSGTMHHPQHEQAEGRQEFIPGCMMQLSADFEQRAKGKMIQGVIIDKALHMQKSYFIIEDFLGDYIQVGVSNLDIQDVNHARRVFRNGLRVTIKELWYKPPMMNGPCFVRVDNPKSTLIVDAPDISPKDLISWHEMGNKLFVAKDSSGNSLADRADHCWKKATDFLTPVFAQLLSNRSLAYFKANKFSFAVRDSAAAATLDPNNCKHVIRLLHALHSLGGNGNSIALSIARATVQRWPNEQIKKLSEDIGRDIKNNKYAVSSLSTTWWEDISGFHDSIFGLVSEIKNATSSAKYSASADWEELKNTADIYFRDGQLADATNGYTLAIRAFNIFHTERLQKLLSNRAFAAQKDAQLIIALKLSTAAAVINPEWPKAWLRRGAALCMMSKFALAERCLDVMKELRQTSGDIGGTDKDIALLQQMLTTASKTIPTTAPATTARINTPVTTARTNAATAATVTPAVAPPVAAASVPENESAKTDAAKKKKNKKKGKAAATTPAAPATTAPATAAPMKAVPVEAAPKIKSSTAEQQKLVDESGKNTNHVRDRDDQVLPNIANLMASTIESMMPKQILEMLGRPLTLLPDFRKELLEQDGRWPSFVDAAAAGVAMDEEYANSRASMYTNEMNIRMATFNDTVKPADLLKRLHRAERMQWYCDNREVGDVCPELNATYEDVLVKSFSNQPYRTEILAAGTTHCAVQFVDLGFLLSCDICALDENTAPNVDASRPLLFFGVDRSAYAVAKSLVILHMLQMTVSDLRSVPNGGKGSGDVKDTVCRAVLQVWFSATWEPFTTALFHLAVDRVIQEQEQKQQEQQHKNKNKRQEQGRRKLSVDDYLQHWNRSAGASLGVARQQWRARQQRTGGIAHLKRRIDRIQQMRYFVTGDFGLTAEHSDRCSGLVGSVTMFQNPDSSPPLSYDETVFSVVRPAEIVGYLRENQTKQELSLFKALERFLLLKVRRLVDWLINGEVRVQLRHSTIEDAVQEVAALCPYTISWSNAMDYMKQDDFHRVARACSAHGDTVHFGYSMNWPATAYGTHIFDYRAPELTEIRKRHLLDARQLDKNVVTTLGCEHIYQLPRPGNPYNELQHYLSAGIVPKWAKWWQAQAQRTGFITLLMNEVQDLANVLASTGDCSAFLTWTYDESINVTKVVV